MSEAATASGFLTAAPSFMPHCMRLPQQNISTAGVADENGNDVSGLSSNVTDFENLSLSSASTAKFQPPLAESSYSL